MSIAPNQSCKFVDGGICDSAGTLLQKFEKSASHAWRLWQQGTRGVTSWPLNHFWLWRTGFWWCSDLRTRSFDYFALWIGGVRTLVVIRPTRSRVRLWLSLVPAGA